MPGFSALGGGTSRTSMPATKDLPGVSLELRCLSARLVKGDSSLMHRTSSSSSSGVSGNFLL